MSAQSVQAAKRALLAAMDALNLGRAIGDDATKLAHMNSLISHLERELKLMQNVVETVVFRLHLRR